MASNKTDTTSHNVNRRIIDGQQVSKPIWNEFQVFCARLAEITNMNNRRRFEHEWLRLVREPHFQDKRNRYAQAAKVVRIVVGTDIKTTGQLLTQRCLAGGGSGGVVKRRRKVMTKAGGAASVGAGGAAGEMENEGGSGENDDEVEVGGAGMIGEVGGDEMVVDENGNHDHLDEMQIDDDSFHDSRVPPSSPTPLRGPQASKTPARPSFATHLPTPDSTPHAQFFHGGDERKQDNDPRSRSDVLRENRELKSQMMHLSAVARDLERGLEMMKDHAYVSGWISKS